MIKLNGYLAADNGSGVNSRIPGKSINAPPFGRRWRSVMLEVVVLDVEELSRIDPSGALKLKDCGITKY